MATRYFLNRINTSTSGGWTVGPTMRVELREMPVEVAAEASNTARTFVVELDSLMTMWIGR